MYYYYHPESECLWEQEEPLEADGYDNGLVSELYFDQYFQLKYGEPMSIETLLAANIKATEALTAALTLLAPALSVAATEKPKKAAKEKVETPASTDTPATGAAASTPTAGGTATTAAPAGPLAATDPFSIAVTAFAKAHGRDAALGAIDKFGGAGRASNIKEIDRPAAHEYVKAEHARLDAIKAAAAAAAAQPSAEASLI